MANRTQLSSVEDLADAARVSVDLVRRYSDNSRPRYKLFSIPKRSGGRRRIASPKAPLAALQAWILRNILDHIDLHPCATAFRRGIGLAANVQPHVGKGFLLTLDIEDFFDNIPYSHVFTVFSALGYPDEVSHCLAALCTVGRRLPQGGITSPALSNAVCIRLDRRVSACASRLDLAYTRYADDLTFSGDSEKHITSMCRLATEILGSEGFTVNRRKTRLARPAGRHIVTGLVVRDDGFGITREQKRRLRAILHRLYCQPLTPAERTGLSLHVDGWFAFLNSVDQDALRALKSYEDRLRQA